MEGFAADVTRRLGGLALSGAVAAVAALGAAGSPALGSAVTAAAANGPQIVNLARTGQVAENASVEQLPAGDPQNALPLQAPRAHARGSSGTGAAEQTATRTSDVRASAGTKVGVFDGKSAPGLPAAVNAPFNFVPPDSTGAIGPDHFVEGVNDAYAVYDRNTMRMVSMAQSNTFFKVGATRFVSDPQVQYDPRSGRWYAVATTFLRNNPLYGNPCPPANGLCDFTLVFAWSKTSDPSDMINGWCSYSWQSADPTIFLRDLWDYPKIALDDNFLEIGTEVFDFGTPNQDFVTDALHLVSKPGPGTTCPASGSVNVATTFPAPIRNLSDTTLAGVIVPANTYATGPGKTTWIVAAHDPHNPVQGTTPTPASNVLFMHVVNTAGGGCAAPPCLSIDFDLPVNTYDAPRNIPQPGTPFELDALDGRVEQASAAPDPSQGGKMGVWFAHAVSEGSTVATDRVVERWYEVVPENAAASRIIHQGMITGGAKTYAWNMSISPTTSGDEAAVNFSWVDATGSAPSLVQIRAGSRVAADPANTFGSFITIANSAAATVDYSCGNGTTQPPCRWGDYSALFWDPKQPHVVWGSNQTSGTPYVVSPTLNLAQWQTQNFALTTAPSGSTASGPYVPVAPYRILDTRTTASLGPGGTVDVQVTGTGGTGGVPASGVGAVSVNVTGLNASQSTYLTVYPQGPATRPLASTVNFGPGQQVANLTEIPVGSTGKITVYNSQGNADVVLDVQGYTLSSIQANSAGLYKPLNAPTRILDTRTGTPFAAIPGNTSKTLNVPLSDPRAGAVIMNVTAVNGAAPGYLTVYPGGVTTVPTASNVNFPAGKNVPNRVMAQLGSGANAGQLNIYNGSTAPVDVVVDLNGWFTDGTDPAATGSTFHALTPARILDTRAASAIGPYNTPFGPNSSRLVTVAGMGGVPAMGATSVVGNATVTNATAGSFLTLYPADSAAVPNASDLNFGPGDTLANMVVVRLAGDQSIYVYNNLGSVDVLLDATGYYG